MKVTKSQLQNIIKEEYNLQRSQQQRAQQMLASAEGALQDLVNDTSNELSFEDSRIKELRNTLLTFFRNRK